jgi:hypothetical protein
MRILKGFLILLFPVYQLFANSLSHNSDFKSIFFLREVITLYQSKEIIGNVRKCQIDKDGYIWVLDSKMCKIKKYDRKGKLILSFGGKGEGPGEFFQPSSFTLDNGRIYVVDPFRRLVSVFSKNGKYENSFKIRDGREIKKLENRDEIIIAAPLLEESACLHIYIKNGNLEKSFFPISKLSLQNHLVCDGVYFDLDSKNNIYAIQEMDYNIHKFTIEGELIKTFYKKNTYYIPPPLRPFKEFYLKSALEEWVKSWTHIIGIHVLNDFVIVVLYNLKAEEYILDIYDLDGNFIAGGLKTQYRLLCVDKGWKAYFLKEEEKGSKIIFNLLEMSVVPSKLNIHNNDLKNK